MEISKTVTWISEVREADLEPLAAIYEELIGDNVDIQLPKDKLLEVARTYINKEDRNIFVLRDEQGNPQGMIACIVIDNPYLLFKSKTAQEIVWAVRKPYRRYSKQLLDLFFEWAKTKEANKILVSSRRNPYLEKYYTNLGFKEEEKFFSIEVN